jgi:hypothetical protein
MFLDSDIPRRRLTSQFAPMAKSPAKLAELLTRLDVRHRELLAGLDELEGRVDQAIAQLVDASRTTSTVAAPAPAGDN